MVNVFEFLNQNKIVFFIAIIIVLIIIIIFFTLKKKEEREYHDEEKEHHGKVEKEMKFNPSLDYKWLVKKGFYSQVKLMKITGIYSDNNLFEQIYGSFTRDEKDDPKIREMIKLRDQILGIDPIKQKELKEKIIKEFQFVTLEGQRSNIFGVWYGNKEHIKITPEEFYTDFVSRTIYCLVDLKDVGGYYASPRAIKLEAINTEYFRTNFSKLVNAFGKSLKDASEFDLNRVHALNLELQKQQTEQAKRSGYAQVT
jgi:thioredoxin-related protein